MTDRLSLFVVSSPYCFISCPSYLKLLSQTFRLLRKFLRTCQSLSPFNHIIITTQKPSPFNHIILTIQNPPHSTILPIRFKTQPIQPHFTKPFKSSLRNYNIIHMFQNPAHSTTPPLPL